MRLPLKPFPLSLLAALAAGEAHAYAIEQQMKLDAQDMMIYSRAVYREIPRLVAAKVIEPVPATRPVRYRLTKYGRTLLVGERERSLRTYRLLQGRV